jgi:hypothetical protein
MFKFFKLLHFIGLTLFLGSVWVFIAQGTLMTTIALTCYVREMIVHTLRVITLPGLILIIFSGIGMIICRNILLRSTFFKVKIITAIVILANSIYLSHIAQQALTLASALPKNSALFHQLTIREAIHGAINVWMVLFLIAYSVYSRKRTIER